MTVHVSFFTDSHRRYTKESASGCTHKGHAWHQSEGHPTENDSRPKSEHTFQRTSGSETLVAWQRFLGDDSGKQINYKRLE